MKAKIARLVAGLIQLPIVIYITYYILTAIHASELIMFLFWVYIPLSIGVNLLAALTDDK
jgi:hypothetical protein